MTGIATDAPRTAVAVPHLPPAAEETLSNGLTVIAVHRPSTPLVELRLHLPFAGAPQGPALLLSQTFTDGTDRLSRQDVAEQLDLLGARVGMSVDADRLLLAGGVLAPAVEPFLALLLTLLTRAAYPESRLATLRMPLAQRLEIGRADPAAAAIEHLNRAIYGDHPYARAAARPESVTTADRESVRALAAERLRPTGATLVLVGDLLPDRALDVARRVLGDWPGGPPLPPNPPAPATWPGATQVVDRPRAVQSVIRAALPARPLTHPMAPEQELANLVLGGYFSSRLVGSLRERHGYAYSPSTALVFPEAASALVVSVDAATEVTAAAYAEIGRLLAGMGQEPPTPREVDHARQFAIGRRHRALSTQASVADLTTDLASRGLRLDWLRRYCGRLAEVAASDVAAVAGPLADPSGASTVVLGDLTAVHASSPSGARWAEPW
ncbi:M16 family metallopeptidase [Streptomyces sp. NPDC013181]|uniref:M16 family metallopeptidase n=1 Tax=Streptomyces sp. NPDC013181 TaxID=3364864 RepID=UPI0036BBE957